MEIELTKQQMKAKLDLLESHHKGAIRELEKVQKQLYATQDAVKNLQSKLDNKKHTEQLAGWAIDRALEASKLMPDGSKPKTVADLVKIARDICDGVKEISDQLPIPEIKEAA